MKYKPKTTVRSNMFHVMMPQIHGEGQQEHVKGLKNQHNRPKKSPH